MPRQKSDQAYEAVLFMQDHCVIKQMRYREFEAILDGVVGMQDYADSEATLVYVELDRRLRIKGVVFFLLYFDETGRADPEWNLPLRELARTAGPGPSMGAGPVRLCCRSQCPISWHQKTMWDPGMAPGSNDFQAIRRALTENRLGFEIEPEPVSPGNKTATPSAAVSDEHIPVLVDRSESASHGGLSREHRLKIARVIRSQRLHIKTLMGQHREELAEAGRAHRIEMQAMKTELQDYRQRLEQIRIQNEQLKEKLDRRNEQYLALQEKLSETKSELAEVEARLTAVDQSARESARRAQDRLEAELVILKEQLDRRDSELFYRSEREDQLKHEIEALKQAAEQSTGQGNILRKLADLDVVFVVYHAGAGHITIPPRDVERYVANPVAYAAAKCHVGEDHYSRWLEHYEQSRCVHRLPGGSICGEPLQRVTVPADFVPGQHNCCEQHKY